MTRERNVIMAISQRSITEVRKSLAHTLDLEAVVEEHAPMLVSFIAGLMGSRQEAEDIAQDTFVRACRNFRSFEGDTLGFAAWLRTIARNQVTDRIRKRSREPDQVRFDGVEELFAALDRPEDTGTWTDRVAPLRQCLQQLPDKLRDACYGHYFHGRSAGDVAERCGASRAAILKRLERARGLLKTCIERRLLKLRIGD